MPISDQQLLANRQNALKSTGPVTDAGKARVSGNAVHHGILSGRLILHNEREEDFHRLLIELITCLAPVGTLESALVDRIAVSLWRQRRLIRAESAAIEIQLQPDKIAREVSKLIYGYGSITRVNEEDLTEGDQEQLEWCTKVITELEKLTGGSMTHMSELKSLAPMIYEQLLEDARTEEESIEGYLATLDGGLTEYLHDLGDYCREEIEKVKRRPEILQMAEWMRSSRAVAGDSLQQKFVRYQTSLDNNLYKALKALREAQQWRMVAIEVTGEADVVTNPASA